jgi:hypothetical protein
MSKIDEIVHGHPQDYSSVMPNQHFVLTDVSQRIWKENFNVGPSDNLRLLGSDAWSVKKYALRGGLSDGIDVVELDNGKLSVSILPTRGMGLWRGTCDGLELGWKSPVALPVHPAFVDARDRGGIGWLAGFNEWLCRCGLEFNGPPTDEGTLHGRIANRPAHYVDVSISTDGPGSIAVSGSVDETTMFGACLRLKSTVRTEAGSNRLRITDEVTNLRGVPGELELLYHINMGRPFLEPGAKFVAPIREVAPRDPRAAEGIDTFDSYAAPVAGYAEQCYFFDLAADGKGWTQTLLKNAHGDKGVSVCFDTKQLPCFTLWKNTQSEQDGYVTGLEPATNFPNPKDFERKQGRVINLAAGAAHTSSLEIVVHSTPRLVQSAEHEIGSLQQSPKPQVHRQPQAKWSPP